MVSRKRMRSALFILGLALSTVAGCKVLSVNADESKANDSKPLDAHATCGRSPEDPVKPVRWPYGKSPRCDALETRWANVLHEDLACKSDADCMLVMDGGHCVFATLNKKAATQPRYQTWPCGNPAAGPCAANSEVPHCKSGCCTR